MPIPIEKHFGEVLKNLRMASGMSQEALAFESELDRSFISMMERGLRVPTIHTLFQLAKGLKISPSKMIEALEKVYEN